MDQYIGKLLDNRYELLELIGVGGMARVYKARCHRLNRLVALKILREDMAQDAEFRRRFHDESQAVAMLSHPNIVAVYDVSRSSEMEYIVMELIDGITLKQYIRKKGNKLNWREALHFTTQIVKALGHAHSRGIIHRDIKPHNVMVLRDGSVKVADFGIARVLSSARHSTLTQEALGSVHYISPEQARGSNIDARSDLYSAGVVLYEMITGRLPFEGDTAVSVAIQHINSIPLSPKDIDPEIPEALEKITMKAMAPNPDNRYGSADEMLADLEEFRKNPSINFDYELWAEPVTETEEKDSEKTQIHISTGAGQGRERVRTEKKRERARKIEEEDEDEFEPRGGLIGSVLLAVVAVLGFVGVVAFFLYKTFFASILAPAPTYQVPNLVGKQYEVVQTAPEYSDFKIVLGNTVADAEYEAGQIIRQEPAANSTVGEAGKQITVVVSSGPEKIMMIDLYNMEYREAYLEVERMGLRALTPEYEHNDVVAYNHIISYTPLKDTVLAPGDAVKMVVSLGPESLKVDMPKLVGLSQEQAVSKLTFQHLEIGDIRSEYHPTIPAGEVMDQYPTEGTQVSEGTKVNLQISLGPDPSTIVPEPEPEPPAQTGPQPKVVSIPLPVSDDLVRLTVKLDGEAIMDAEIDAAMNDSVDLTINPPAGGSGVRVLYVYYDNALNRTISVEF